MAAPDLGLILSHITENLGDKSRKSSLIVLSWLAKDRQQAINKTQDGGRTEMGCFHILNPSENRENRKVVWRVFTFLSISSELFRWVQRASDIIYDRGFMINCGKIHGTHGFINILGKDLHFSTRPTNFRNH